MSQMHRPTEHIAEIGQAGLDLAVGFEKHNQELIEEFIASVSPLSDSRILKYRVTLGRTSRILGKNFDAVTQEDLREYIQRVDRKEDYSDWTKQDYRQLVRNFFGWLRDPGFVDWVRLGKVWSRVSVDDLLTDEELQSIRSVCCNPRDRALVETAYEAAFRPHELLSLKKSSGIFDGYGASIFLGQGKTGPRRVRVVNATPLLANWIANHPLGADGAPLWVDMSSDTKHRPLSWTGLSEFMKRAAKRAGVAKRVNPYIFRHARLTHLSKVLTESVLCEFAGWVQGSDMPRNYVHLSGRDVDEAILRAYGLIKSGETFKPDAPKKCVRCTTLNPHDADICYRCGFALSDEVTFRRDDEVQKLKAAVEQMKSEIGRLVGKDAPDI